MSWDWLGMGMGERGRRWRNETTRTAVLCESCEHVVQEANARGNGNLLLGSRLDVESEAHGDARLVGLACDRRCSTSSAPVHTYAGHRWANDSRRVGWQSVLVNARRRCIVERAVILLLLRRYDTDTIQISRCLLAAALPPSFRFVRPALFARCERLTGFALLCSLSHAALSAAARCRASKLQDLLGLACHRACRHRKTRRSPACCLKSGLLSSVMLLFCLCRALSRLAHQGYADWHFDWTGWTVTD